MAHQPLIERMRPEIAAGGFSRADGTVQFYTRINSLLRPEMIVLDLGAGRGAFLEGKCVYTKNLQLLQGKVREVIGIDVDPAVAQHPALDSYFIVAPSSPLPLRDESIDLIVSDWVFEHVEEPEFFAKEITRTLKPGGWICARTNNKVGLIAMMARAIPDRLHNSALHWLQPTRKAADSFPLRYKMNTRQALRGLFPSSRWHDCSYFWRGDPAYHAEQPLLWYLTEFIYQMIPIFLSPSIFVFLQKKATQGRLTAL